MKFKTKEVEDRFPLMHEIAQKIATEMDAWARENYNIEITITATVSTAKEDKVLGRRSDTHRTGRAFDVRTKDLPDNLIAEMCAVFRKKYSPMAAITDGQRNLIVYRPHGTGPHLHVQIDRKFAKGEINV